ncbi:O-antigen ligase domain-containing protein, partial [Providencia rettgeri]|nr:O-antigen ligase domain-containing protein [Providencia rettgeri]
MLCRSLIIGIFVIFQLTSLIYIDVFGGIHQLILKNIIGWLAMTMIISIVSFSVFYRRNKIVVTVPAICFVIALLFLIMGLFYSKEIKNELLFLYSFGVAISILFYITGLQIKDRWWLQLFCIYCNVVFSLIQAFLTGYQFFAQPGIFYFATDMYSYGLLQQINIISTSIAASSLLAMMMFVLSKFSLVSYKYENLRAIVLGCAIFVFTLTLVILQSITTLLSFMGAIFLFIYLFYKKNKRRVIASCFLVA